MLIFCESKKPFSAGNRLRQCCNSVDPFPPLLVTTLFAFSLYNVCVFETLLHCYKPKLHCYKPESCCYEAKLHCYKPELYCYKTISCCYRTKSRCYEVSLPCYKLQFYSFKAYLDRFGLILCLRLPFDIAADTWNLIFGDLISGK